MSRDFVKRHLNAEHLHRACKQQEQIGYFTKSSTQQDVTTEYLNAWAERKYATNDHFLNFVKLVFKSENFLDFFKYMRHPLPSARFINNRIKSPLKRVFFAEDSYFKYVLDGERVECPEELDAESFDNTLFNALLFRHNDIIITDLSDINQPYRKLININRVVSIDSRDSVISRIAYTAIYGDIKGALYIDDRAFIFYPENDDIPPVETLHDLGRCPADYISAEAFDDSVSDVVRKSIFSYAKEELEEYVFLKTLQRMTEPNGAIPVVTVLKTKIANENNDVKGENGAHPTISQGIGSQLPHVRSDFPQNKNMLQAGNIVQVPNNMKEDGSIDMEIVKSFFNFHYMPVESLEYLNKRLLQIEQSMTVTLLGDHSEQDEDAKNELQVSKSYVSKQDRLREISLQLTRARKRTDYNMMALKYGPSRVEVDLFFGSDFFLETEEEIYTQLSISPNPIESKSLLNKLARTKNRFNEDKYERDNILYSLLPYTTHKDFETAVAAQKVGEITFQFQTRFNYWIEQFEAIYGDILVFWRNASDNPSATLVLLNNLITDLIKTNYERSTDSGEPDPVQG